MEGTVATFNQETLYKHINGEAELFLPYGFDAVATALYVKGIKSEQGILINVFKMGSLLDAFGIYSNYRSSDAKRIHLGVEGFIDESQLMFYKGQYFIQVFASGKAPVDSKSLLACAITIEKNISGEKESPQELIFIQIPGVMHGTERYYVKGLFGNAFFQKGIVADISAKGREGQIFIVLGESPQTIIRNSEKYAQHLQTSGIDYLYTKEPAGIRFKIKDPIHKAMFLQQKGGILSGHQGLKMRHMHGH